MSKSNESRRRTARGRRTSGAGDARSLAVQILRRRFERTIPFQTSFGSAEFARLSLADQLLVRELVGGVVRHFSLIDLWLGEVWSRPLHQLDPVILWILRISIYQIRWLRVPDYASVDEAVRLAGELGRARGRSFVNAVLRAFLRSNSKEPEGSSVEALAARYSHPIWLVERWLARFGAATTEEILIRNNELPPSVVRVNTFRVTTEEVLRHLADQGVVAEALPGIPACIRVESRGFVRHPLYRKGYCFFMDYSSQQVAHLGEVAGAQRIADVCAAPGGKSFILASRLPPGILVLCVDLDRRRVVDMRRRAGELAVPGLRFVQADSAETLPLTSGFDFVLADVPCSGLGTIRSNPDVKWSVREADLIRWQNRQRRILANAFRLLDVGGELVYSTCSTEPEENERVVEDLLASNPRACLQGEFWRSFPSQGPGDGFFAARIRRC